MESYYKEFVENDILKACKAAVHIFSSCDRAKIDGVLIKEFRRLSSLITIFKVTSADPALAVKFGLIVEKIEKVVKIINDGYKTIEAYRSLDAMAFDFETLSNSRKFILE